MTDTADPITASFLLHLDGCITTWSPAVERLLLYSPQDWIGQPESILYPPGAQDFWSQDRAEAERTGSALSVRDFVTKEGAALRAEGVLTALYNSSGSLIGFSRTFRMMTDANPAVGSRLQLAAEAAQVGTWDFSPITGDLQWDDRCRAAYGLPPDAPVDYDTFLAGIHPQDRARADDAVQRALRGENGGEYEIEFRTIGLEDGGALRWVAARGRAFFDANGIAKRFIGTLIDITGRRLTEEALQERDERYSMVTRATRDAIWDWDLITNTIWWNEGVVSLFGYQRDEVVCTADWWYDHIHPEDRVRVVDSIHAVIDDHSSGGHAWTSEYRFRCKDDSFALVFDRGHILRDADGNPLRMIGAMQDVTERRRAEEALREREEFLRRVVESSPDCIKTMDLDGRILSINEGGQQVLEVDDPTDICGADWLTFWEGDTQVAVKAAIETAKQGGNGRFQGYSPTMKGVPLWWDVVVVAILGKDGMPEYLLGISRDITEQRQAAEQIAESEHRFSALFERATVGITLTDLTGRFVLANERYSQISGRTPDDLSLLRLHEITHPDDHSKVESLFSRLIESGEEFGIDMRLVRPDGSHLWVGSSLSLIRRKAEEPLYVQVVSVDLTERKQAEEVKERLQQRERNIATQLQEALIPSEPSNLPGLSLTSFYRPALTDEAGVGGDFFDVFSVEKGCTALVVGDLSGKGLSAASQVAVVRNMLRYAIYTGTTLVEAIGHLNHVLAEQNLLTGFATLFVGAYDQAQRTLTYVNCGQEPALIWRQSTGLVEELGPTGPVLGGFQEGAFTERVAHLDPGDVIAIFTDGLTEVGPTRKRFLEVEGVADLLYHCCAANAESSEERERGAGARYIRDRVIEGVDAYARNGIRDDIALLVGIVEGSDRVV